jgi:hypothetical protein
MRLRSLVVFAAALTVTAHASAQTTVAPKDAGVATLLGIVFPGGGHYYAEEPGRGALLTIGTVASVAIGAALDKGPVYEAEVSTNGPINQRLVKPADHSSVIAGAGIGAAIWLLGAIDAPRAAHRTNDTNTRRVTLLADPHRLGLTIALH